MALFAGRRSEWKSIFVSLCTYVNSFAEKNSHEKEIPTKEGFLHFYGGICCLFFAWELVGESPVCAAVQKIFRRGSIPTYV